MTVMKNDKHEVFYMNEITDDTILVALDFSGGECDRLMKGRKGILYNANASIECFNNGGVEEPFKPFDIDSTSDDDLEYAINILQADNFHVCLVLNQPIVVDGLIVGRDLIVASNIEQSKHLTVVDVTKVDFDENGIYSIY